MSDYPTSIPSSPAAKAALRELELQAVRLRAGLAHFDDLIRAADGVLNAGIYSHELAQVALFLEKHASALSGPFLRGVDELGLNPPQDEDGMIWYLLRRYIGDVAEGTIEPEKGASRVVYEVDHRFPLCRKIRRYIGDSYGYEHIFGLYHAYDDVSPERFPEVDSALIEACRDWLREYGGD